MDPQALTLRRLNYFVTVADELHFGRAAEILHVAQPALSQQIRQLESYLGLRLFERTTRRVSLTPGGSALLPHARHLLVTAQGVARAAAELRAGQRGHLRVGFVDSAAYEFVPRFLHRFRQSSPAVTLQLHTMSSDEQAEALVVGRIDIGIARITLDNAGLEATVLDNEPLVAAMPSSHRLAGESSIRLGDLREDEFVGFSREQSPTLHARLRVMLAPHGVDYSPAIEATEYTTILGLVAAGEGVALVPAGVQSLRLPDLTFVSLSDPEAGVQLLCLIRVDEPSAIVASALKELIDTVFAQTQLS
ncbi:MAG: LysR family transcriptional regulator [Acidimicrobiaceae bacterium]|nr:LysR family transcriptional regulator [Acidimicrobiaceae bacterium]